MPEHPEDREPLSMGPAVDLGVVRAIYDYEGHWVTPSRWETPSDDYSEDSFA